MKRIIYYFIILFFTALLFQSCSSTKTEKFDDAVRIKKEHWDEFGVIPGTNQPRNASALRGTVLRIETVKFYCNNELTNDSTYIVFKDKNPKSEVEFIPIEKIDLVGTKTEVGLGLNWFERFNDPLNPREIREVEVVEIKLDTCSGDKPSDHTCDCQPLGSFSLKCPNDPCRSNTLKNRNYFLELKAGYAFYNDYIPALIGEAPQEAYFGEFAGGYRFGSRGQYGIGLSYFTGVPIYNSLDNDLLNPGGISIEEDEGITRDALFLHGRYSFDKTWCMFPFVYGQLGAAIDDLSMDFWNFELGCRDCKREIKANDDVSLSGDIALSYGLGIGVDIPVSCTFDLSVDMGFKSLSVGEKGNIPISGVIVPESRRVNMFLVRIGITL